MSIYMVCATGCIDWGCFEADNTDEAIIEANKAAGFATLKDGARRFGYYEVEVDEYLKRFQVIPVETLDGVGVFKGYYRNSQFCEINRFKTREEVEGHLRSEGITPSLCGRYWSGSETYILERGEEDRPIYKIA